MLAASPQKIPTCRCCCTQTDERMDRPIPYAFCYSFPALSRAYKKAKKPGPEILKDSPLGNVDKQGMPVN